MAFVARAIELEIPVSWPARQAMACGVAWSTFQSLRGRGSGDGGGRELCTVGLQEILKAMYRSVELRHICSCRCGFCDFDFLPLD